MPEGPNFLGENDDAENKESSSSEGSEESQRESGSENLVKLKMILDVPLKVSAELGRATLMTSEVLELSVDSVIQLDKMAGEPMEVYINNRFTAMGEVVVINDKVGIRLTDVASNTEP